MEKSKKIQIRVSEEFNELVNGLSEKYKISKTNLIIKCILSSKIEHISLSEQTEEERRLMSYVGRNMNQVGRAMNQLVRDYRLNENKSLSEYSKELLYIGETLTEMLPIIRKLEEYEAERAKQLSKEGYIKRKEYFDEDVLDYLMKYDPTYLEEILKNEGKKI